MVVFKVGQKDCTGTKFTEIELQYVQSHHHQRSCNVIFIF